MSCKICHCVAIPDSNPEICPECLTDKQFVVGIDDRALTANEVRQRWGSSIDENTLTSKLYLDGAFSFHQSDLGDLVVIIKSTGEPTVLVNDAWVKWQSYLELVEAKNN